MLKRFWQPALLVPILLLAYRGGLGRDFTSEDFLILRRLGSGGFWERAAESFQGPWLGASFVPFFRPFSSLLLQLELLVFGASPLPYLLLHLAVHAATALLLAAWLGILLPESSRVEIFLATLVFALYPLHPNTVLFIASFATLFATFFLVATLYFEASDRRGLALLAAPLALLCYEQAVVLPALVLLFDLAARPGDGWRRRLRLWPYFAMTAAYLLVRGVLLGRLGGYDGFRERLFDPAGVLRSLGEILGRLFVPFFGIASGMALVLTVAATLAALTLLAWWRRREPGALVLLAALAAIALVQAPFFFVGVVPGNGRYFYLASAFVAIVLWQGLRLAARRAALLPALCLGLTAAIAAYGLGQVVEIYGQAAQQARKIRTTLEAAPPGRLFVAGAPHFAYRWGVPVAQMFHWGLADALKPPFSERTDLEVYPLPELDDAALAPLLQRPELGRVARLGQGDSLEWLPAPPYLPQRLEAMPDARKKFASRYLRVHAVPGTTLRMIVLSQGGPSVLPLPPGEEVVAEVPKETLEAMRHLYGAPLFFWVEARNPQGVLVAASEIVEP